jgi:Short C-terminal domain/zinc-ribbon domain
LIAPDVRVKAFNDTRMDFVSLQYCRSCGNSIKDGAKFCTTCGDAIVGNATNRNFSDDIFQAWDGTLKKVNEATDRILPVAALKKVSEDIDKALPIEEQAQTEAQHMEKQEFVLPWVRVRNNAQQTQAEAQHMEKQDFIPPATDDDFPGETVLLRVTQSKIQNYFFPHSIIATERALKLKEPTVIAKGTITEIPYEQIHSIKRIGGVFFSTLKISAGVYGEIEIDRLYHSDADAVIEVVHKRQAELRMTVSPLPQKTRTFSVAEELQKLATLRDEGILTDNEFQTAKKRLLSGELG